ncbi:phage tail sheath family protein [Endozoicomonadaceae bacterium StTr2]
MPNPNFKKTPNVYVQEKSIFPPSVAEVATAIPAFIGCTELAADAAGETLVNEPVRITSMLDYERWFGGPDMEAFANFEMKVEDIAGSTDTAYIDMVATKPASAVADFILYHCVAHFFANGGGACYVISTGTYYDNSATSANKPNKPEDAFAKALNAVAKVDEVTLLVLSDAVRLKDKYYPLCQQAIMQCSKLMDRFALVDVIDSLDPDMGDADVAAARSNMPSEVGQTKYAAAYYPYLRLSKARSYDEDKVTYTVHNMSKSDSEQDDTAHKMSALKSSNTAAYNRLKSLLDGQQMILPPCAAMAGIYARVDASRGVWKAPANVSVSGVVGPVHAITNDDQARLNVDATSGKSINAIRAFTGKGTMVWGARTLAGNDAEWRYVSVRRLFNMVEESVQKATNFAVFEPNTPFTWLKLKTMIESYLENLWRQGALFGDSKEQAFFVNVGLGQTMTEADINDGVMNIEIGMAAVRPAEFIMLTFSHKSLEG